MLDSKTRITRSIIQKGSSISRRLNGNPTPKMLTRKEIRRMIPSTINPIRTAFPISFRVSKSEIHQQLEPIRFLQFSQFHSLVKTPTYYEGFFNVLSQ
jgi:hypothetical protein